MYGNLAELYVINQDLNYLKNARFIDLLGATVELFLQLR